MVRIALKYLLVTAFVSGIVALIWLGHASDHIKHVDYVPPPITAPRAKSQPHTEGLGTPKPSDLNVAACSICGIRHIEISHTQRAVPCSECRGMKSI